MENIYIEQNKAVKLITEDGQEIVISLDSKKHLNVQASFSSIGVIPVANNSIKLVTIDYRVPDHIKRKNNIEWCKHTNKNNAAEQKTIHKISNVLDFTFNDITSGVDVADGKGYKTEVLIKRSSVMNRDLFLKILWHTEYINNRVKESDHDKDNYIYTVNLNIEKAKELFFEIANDYMGLL